MSFSQADGLVWMVASLLAFIWIQRWLHQEMQAVLVLLTHHSQLSLGIFSLLFFPGVFLHESSHFLMARLLRVKTGRFSLVPQTMPDGNLRLGYVETASADIFRDGLIGAAPLLSGGIVVAIIAVNRLSLGNLTNYAAIGDWTTFWQGLSTLPALPDFWLWFYLVFAVSSTMLPSQADRRAWLPVGITLGIILLIAVFAGAGPWMMANIAPAVNRAFRSIALIFVISLAVHFVLAVPAWILHRIISRISGYDIA